MEHILGKTRLAGYTIALLALLGTLAMNGFTLAQVARARTNVPWWDQWAMVNELAQHQRGAPLWPVLWAPYWGHRLVIPRLLFLADARWLSFTSLTWLTMAVQFLHIALLIALAWRLLGRKPPALLLAGVALILNLLLSPLQIQNFIWGMQTMFPLVFLSATAACLSLAWRSRWSAPVAIACAVVSSLTMPNGILLWPVLVAQSIYLKRGRKVAIALSAVGAVVIAAYLWRYVRPAELGMGIGGMLRHPLDSVLLTGLILGGPFRFIIPVDVALGLLALAVTAHLAIRVSRLPAPQPSWPSALLAILVFLVLSSLSLIAGRLTPAFLRAGAKDLLGVQYFTMICLFWTCVGLLALYSYRVRQLPTPALCFYAMLFACLLLTGIRRQLIEAEDWADFFLGVDAAGAAIVMDVPDEVLLSHLWPVKTERDQRTDYLRQHHLALFHDPRAAWPGGAIADLFSAPSATCSGAIEETTRVDPSSWRIQGWAWDPRTAATPDDILFTDSTGHVIGLARGGLRHGYIPALLVAPNPVPPSHARIRHSDWLGYIRQPDDPQSPPLRLYGVFRSSGAICAIR
jgi:hypothetical protein